MPTTSRMRYSRRLRSASSAVACVRSSRPSKPVTRRSCGCKSGTMRARAAAARAARGSTTSPRRRSSASRVIACSARSNRRRKRRSSVSCSSAQAGGVPAFERAHRAPSRTIAGRARRRTLDAASAGAGASSARRARRCRAAARSSWRMTAVYGAIASASALSMSASARRSSRGPVAVRREDIGRGRARPRRVPRCGRRRVVRRHGRGQ